MKEFIFYSASYVKEDGGLSGNSSTLKFKTFNDAFEWFSTCSVIKQEDLSSAFIPVYFEEIGNRSGKDREK